MQTVRQVIGRRAARLAAIDSVQADLIVEDMADRSAGRNEASEFNIEARNIHWSALEGERQATLAA